MEEKVVYMLWDEKDGYSDHKLYLDEFSANIALREHYTSYWIENKKAMVKELIAVSYKDWDSYKGK